MRARRIGTRSSSLALLLSLFALSLGSCSQAPAHTDHLPRHGGLVLMHGDLHFEVILNKEGRHCVYFSDAVRAELPASIASELTITFVAEHPRDPHPDKLTWEAADLAHNRAHWLVIDEFRAVPGEAKELADVNAVARVAFNAQGRPYWIDVPFGF